MFNRELYEAFKANPEVFRPPASPLVAEMYIRLAGKTWLVHPGGSGAKGDGKCSSIIMAESLAGDKDVLTVEPESRKHIKTVVLRCKK